MTSDTVIEQLDKELTHQTASCKPILLNNLADSNAYETRDIVAEIADRIFRELDSDKDGFITLEEFRDGALKIPMVVKSWTIALIKY